MTHLSGIPETMLWTLHNRASEAMHPRGVIRDPKCIEIYEAISYDYEASFGPPEPSHGVRSQVFDTRVQAFIDANPDAVIVNLGEGLETQRFRVRDREDTLWMAIDVPEAIEVRERFIEADGRHLHLAKSALDRSWFDELPSGRPIFVTAQGLFMYFEEQDVAALVRDLAKRWPGVALMFDHIPRWLSRRTTSKTGWQKTKHYTTPPMPWGVDRPELQPLLRSWAGTVSDYESLPFSFPRGFQRLVFGAFMAIPGLRDRAPGIAFCRLGTS
ncbi:MAG: class I SAM-dependent methyltransferase [Myxococcota bacterium]